MVTHVLGYTGEHEVSDEKISALKFWWHRTDSETEQIFRIGIDSTGKEYLTLFIGEAADGFTYTDDYVLGVGSLKAGDRIAIRSAGTPKTDLTLIRYDNRVAIPSKGGYFEILERTTVKLGATITIKTDGRYQIVCGDGEFVNNYCVCSEDSTIGRDLTSIVLNAGAHHTEYGYIETPIEEPVGFDNLYMSIKRHDYHGVTIAVSESSLEFHDAAAIGIIEKQYADSVDSVVKYFAKDNENLIFAGVLDLTTYKDTTGEYRSISCKVGEIGAKTTFNNRSDTDIDLNTEITIDGDGTEKCDWIDVNIPTKHLKYINKWELKRDLLITTSSGTNYLPDSGAMIIYKYTFGSEPRLVNIFAFPIGEPTTTEFGSTQAMPSYTTYNTDYITPQYICDAEHVDKYGQDTKVSVYIRLLAHVQLNQNMHLDHGALSWRLVAQDRDGNKITGEWQSVLPMVDGKRVNNFDIDTELSGELPADNSIKYYLEFDLDLGTLTGHSYYAVVTVKKESKVEFTMYDNVQTEETPTKALLVHDALNVVSHAISENQLSVKSDWYATPKSKWNATSAIGGGSLKALTNGYKIRDLFTTGTIERNMPVSFKTLIQSLSALDCIGWGFSTEGGADCVRVERWEWFYKDVVVLTIDGAREVERTANTAAMLTELKIGYKKYTDNSTFNSIDSVHGERTMTNKTKAIKTQRTELCDFIADNYAIELTRRARTDVDPSEAYKYDENVFVFELSYISMPTPVGGTPIKTFGIANNLKNSTGIERPKEQINVQLSPRRCAERWRSYMFAMNGATNYRQTSAKLNYNAAFSCYTTDTAQSRFVTHLQDFANGAMLDEAADIEPTERKLTADVISFTYPLKFSEFEALKANPYGLICVNGIYGWLKELKYSYADGEATIKLIAKA